jgi:hypothetical protein
VKRLNWSDYPLTLGAFPVQGLPAGITFHSTHWIVNRWRQGSTYSGSSGAPLFDADEQIIGALTGGFSACSVLKEDYYYALAAAWGADGTPEQRIAQWLNPLNFSVTVCTGLDPYERVSAFRLSNVRNVVPYPRGNVDTDPLNAFGNREDITQFAEAYHAALPLTVFGAYLVTPPVVGSTALPEVDLCLYTGSEGPEQLLYAESFRPSYTSLGGNGVFYETQKAFTRLQESFLRFETPVRVPAGKFFIGYRIIDTSGQSCFSVSNLAPGIVSANTTWFFDGSVWKEATEYSPRPIRTSLYIDPVVRYAVPTAELPLREHDSFDIFVADDRRAIHIVLPEEITTARLSVVAMNGRILLEQTLFLPQSTLSIAFPHGVYLVQLRCDKGFYMQKIVL